MNNILYKKIILIMPSEKSKFSVMYDDYNDLYLGLKKIGFDSEVILLKTIEEYSKFPYFNVKELDIKDLNYIFLSEDQFFLTIDDYNIMNYFFRNKIKLKNLIIWSHFFYGHKFIFERYKKLWEENFGSPYQIKILNYIPFNFLKKNAEFYYIPLKNNRTIAQSLWTDLLLERVYNIFSEGILYTPIEQEYYNVNEYSKENRAMVFFGSKEDVDLFSLKKTVDLLKVIDPRIEFDYFGNEEIGLIFNKKYKENIEYLGKLERKDLSKEYSRHLFTISPIYNGNFEMVPVQSLLCGTPVITYLQPFIEVTGLSMLIANINNINEIKRKINYWINKDLKDDLEVMKNKILNNMDNKKIAMDLLYYLE